MWTPCLLTEFRFDKWFFFYRTLQKHIYQIHKENPWKPTQVRSSRATVLTSSPSTGAARTAAITSTLVAALLTSGLSSRGQSWRHAGRAVAVGWYEQLSATPSSAHSWLCLWLWRALWHHQCKKLESNIQVLIFYWPYNQQYPWLVTAMVQLSSDSV